MPAPHPLRRILPAIVLSAGLLAVGTPASPARTAPTATTQTSTTQTPTTATVAAPSVAAAADQPPNVLVVKTDDQVLDSMDKLAVFMPWTAKWLADSRRFTQAIVADPSCCQSRATTFVGRYPHNHKVWSQGAASVLDSRGGIAPYLAGAGYRTGIVGKFLNLVWTDPPGYQDWTTTHGDTAGEADPTTGTAASWYYNFHATDATGDQIVPDYTTTWTAQRLRTYLADYLSTPSRPWYLEWDPVAPHTHDTLDQMVEPQYATSPVPSCAVPTEPDVSDKPPYVRAFNQPAWRAAKECAAARRTLRSVDRELRSIIGMVQAAGQLPNTLVVFTSDNGLMNGEHGGLFRKYVPYDPSIRVPLFLRWDGQITPGVDDRLTTNTDLLPTILDAAGVTPDPALPPIDGVSLLPGSGPRPAADVPTVQLAEYRLDPGWTPAKPAPIPTWAALRSSHFAYIETYSDKPGTTVDFREYYDLDADPDQLVNLLADGDPTNDPPVGVFSSTLALMRQCAGPQCLRPLPAPVVSRAQMGGSRIDVQGTAPARSTVVVAGSGGGVTQTQSVTVSSTGQWRATLQASGFAGLRLATVQVTTTNVTGALSRTVAVTAS